jgi:serine/threonine protein phosphatase 1
MGFRGLKYDESMPKTYVIPDLHGRDDLLGQGLARIAAHARHHAATVVAIGDYVDKGPHSKQVIDRLLAGLTQDWSLVALKGNHDALMAEALRDTAKMDQWMAKGGRAALASYGGDPAAIPPSHRAWLDQLPLLHVDAHRVYVHAGLDPALPLDSQTQATLLTKRYPKGFTAGFGHRHVVHGHDNCPEGPLLYPGRSNLDTLAWRTGRLTIGVFADHLPGGPVELIVVSGPPAAVKA